MNDDIATRAASARERQNSRDAGHAPPNASRGAAAPGSPETPGTPETPGIPGVEPEPVALKIPRADEALRAWMLMFAGTLAAAPARFLIDPAEAARLVELADAYDAALDHAWGAGSRTQETITRKNAIRDEAAVAFRAMVQRIKVDPGVSLEAKLELGFAVVKPRVREIAPPETAPLLMIAMARDGGHILRYADERRPNRRGKPRGVARLELRVTVTGPATAAAAAAGGGAGTPPADEGAAETRTEWVTRSPFTVEHDPADAGRTATYCGRWCTATGKPGPWGPAVSMTIVSATPPPAGADQ